MKIKKISTLTIFTLILLIILVNCKEHIDKIYTPFSSTSSNSNSSYLNNTATSSNSKDMAEMANINLSTDIYQQYYINRVTTFMNTYSGHGKIIFLGDSLTDIAEWNELLNNPNVLNRGISYDTTSGALNRISEITRLKPSKIFIMLGINDIGKGLTSRNIISNYSKILESIKENSPNTTIYIQSVLPINKDLFKTTTNSKEIIELNNSLKELCKNFDIKYIDLYSLFTLPNENKLYKEYTVDGLHINGKGYIVWRDAVKDYCK
ncbi:GDSL-type esterase/lipase family protein [Clostridium kluyveri]|uniref:SGNH hydrolase n=1 Tax=Clostridium kluyveri TaxID=1534 RepID=A0A1L5F7M8_CLOKL|nr:GDSL-type esterase/lipase family protein [Clostridium kluyveri]APM39036.1 SGNH hydrolase [Clostridium kluyveri]UZQ51362.1 GDSL-type esterase/lipase family protein [Clostridium kluyveri]